MNTEINFAMATLQVFPFIITVLIVFCLVLWALLAIDTQKEQRERESMFYQGLKQDQRLVIKDLIAQIRIERARLIKLVGFKHKTIYTKRLKIEQAKRLHY